MAAREAYWRAWVAAGAEEVSIGLEQRADDDHRVQLWLHDVGSKGLSIWHTGEANVVDYIECKLKKYYPDRAYFIETEVLGRGVQVYQPWGVPRVDQ